MIPVNEPVLNGNEKNIFANVSTPVGYPVKDLLSNALRKSLQHITDGNSELPLRMAPGHWMLR